MTLYDMRICCYKSCDSIYTPQKKNTRAYMGGVGVKQNLESKNGTRSNRDPCMTLSMTLYDVRICCHKSCDSMYIPVH